MKNQNKNDSVGELGVCFSLILVAILILRFWIFLIPILAVTLIIKIRKCYKINHTLSQNQVELSNEEESDKELGWYIELLKSITNQVQNEFPGAKWVWGQANAKKSVMDGNEVYIILNQSGGYRRAKVIIENFRLVCLDFIVAEACQEEQPEENELLNLSTGEMIDRGEDRQNYELLAYDWVQSNIMRLNDNYNEAIGRGETEQLIPTEELPVKDSWIHICKELVREGIKEVECVSEGIKIKLT